jgi:hypothetical protein
MKQLLSISTKASVVIGLLLLFGGNASADLPFDVEGSTAGKFYLGSTNIPLGNSIGGLTFTGTHFGPTTGENLVLGTFSLSSILAYFDPLDFKLSLAFVAPVVASAAFTADLSGLVSVFGGSATVNFIDNGPRHFTFTSAQGSGTFDLLISDVTVANGSSASILGAISNATFATTPEPTTLLLTGALFCVALVVFRKRLRDC